MVYAENTGSVDAAAVAVAVAWEGSRHTGGLASAHCRTREAIRGEEQLGG